jgi:hypothetical protein
MEKWRSTIKRNRKFVPIPCRGFSTYLSENISKKGKITVMMELN